MKLYRCDKCGLEVTSFDGIVGNEYDYSSRFETLSPAYRYANVVDVCKACFKILQKAVDASKLAARQDERERYLRLVEQSD